MAEKMWSKNIDRVSDRGVRLRNPRFFCFLNTAVNAVVTNRKLRSQLLDENTVKLWGENVLIDHDPNFERMIVEGYDLNPGVLKWDMRMFCILLTLLLLTRLGVRIFIV